MVPKKYVGVQLSLSVRVSICSGKLVRQQGIEFTEGVKSGAENAVRGQITGNKPERRYQQKVSRTARV